MIFSDFIWLKNSNGINFAMVFMVLVFKIVKTPHVGRQVGFQMFKVYVNGIRRLIS